MPTYPLLDIDAAKRDAEHNFREVAGMLATLFSHATPEAPPPPGAGAALENVNALLELASTAFPPALVEAIAKEQAQYEEDDAYWSRE